jgi:hypothetical protein
MGTDKFYLSLFENSLAMMHVIDVQLDSFTKFFRHHRYSPLEKLYSVILFNLGLNLRDIFERFCLTYASRDSVRMRGLPNAIKFLKMVLRSCGGKPIVVVDRGRW